MTKISTLKLNDASVDELLKVQPGDRIQLILDKGEKETSTIKLIDNLGNIRFSGSSGGIKHHVNLIIPRTTKYGQWLIEIDSPSAGKTVLEFELVESRKSDTEEGEEPSSQQMVEQKLETKSLENDDTEAEEEIVHDIDTKEFNELEAAEPLESKNLQEEIQEVDSLKGKIVDEPPVAHDTSMEYGASQYKLIENKSYNEAYSDTESNEEVLGPTHEEVEEPPVQDDEQSFDEHEETETQITDDALPEDGEIIKEEVLGLEDTLSKESTENTELDALVESSLNQDIDQLRGSPTVESGPIDGAEVTDSDTEKITLTDTSNVKPSDKTEYMETDTPPVSVNTFTEASEDIEVDIRLEPEISENVESISAKDFGGDSEEFILEPTSDISEKIDFHADEIDSTTEQEMDKLSSSTEDVSPSMSHETQEVKPTENQLRINETSRGFKSLDEALEILSLINSQEDLSFLNPIDLAEEEELELKIPILELFSISRTHIPALLRKGVYYVSHMLTTRPIDLYRMAHPSLDELKQWYTSAYTIYWQDNHSLRREYSQIRSEFEQMKLQSSSFLANPRAQEPLSVLVGMTKKASIMLERKKGISTIGELLQVPLEELILLNIDPQNPLMPKLWVANAKSFLGIS